MSPFIFGFFIGVPLGIALLELIHCSVFGWFIKESELDAYLGKYLNNMRLNEFSRNGTLFAGIPRYVACSSASLLARWHIEDAGVIPRWSKWSKRLDEKRASLLPKIKKLSDL